MPRLRRTLRVRTLAQLVLASLVLGCGLEPAGGSGPSAASSGKADEIHGDGLWAGLVTYTIERGAYDPCNADQSPLDQQTIEYGDWARQRAVYRNICFQVWMPGVTDMENPDFWRLLDVQAHYRYRGEHAYRRAYVDAIDRRGNNRRYAFGLGLERDPFMMVPTIASVPVPFAIASENGEWASVTAELEVKFVVNGRELTSSVGEPFRVRYVGNVRMPSLDAREDGHVLYPYVTCGAGALEIGSGAGYFAADVREPAAVAALGVGLDGSLAYGTGVSKSGEGEREELSIHLGFSAKPTEALWEFSDTGYGNATATARPTEEPGTLRLTLRAYERATGGVRELAWTFHDCAANEPVP